MSICAQIIRATRTRRATRVIPSAVVTIYGSMEPVPEDVTTPRSADCLSLTNQSESSALLTLWCSLSGDGSAHGSGVRGWGGERPDHRRRASCLLLGGVQQHVPSGSSYEIQLQLRPDAAAALPPLRIMGFHIWPAFELILCSTSALKPEPLNLSNHCLFWAIKSALNSTAAIWQSVQDCLRLFWLIDRVIRML